MKWQNHDGAVTARHGHPGGPVTDSPLLQIVLRKLTESLVLTLTRLQHYGLS